MTLVGIKSANETGNVSRAAKAISLNTKTGRWCYIDFVDFWFVVPPSAGIHE